jgi:hypothetical protein
MRRRDERADTWAGAALRNRQAQVTESGRELQLTIDAIPAFAATFQARRLDPGGQPFRLTGARFSFTLPAAGILAG